MNERDALRWAGRYFLWKALFGAVGAAFAAVAAAYAGYPLYLALRYDQPFPGTGTLAVAGLLVLLGVVAWQVGTLWAFYRTLTGAVAEEVSSTYDTEKVKSDILSVLDDRLADLQSDVNAVNRNVQEVTRPEEDFQFDD